MLLNSQEVISFFKSWGLDAEDDNASIPGEVYNRMVQEASKVGGMSLRVICTRLIDAVDDEFYLSTDSWEEVTTAYARQSILR
jgi:hypothetical protein